MRTLFIFFLFINFTACSSTRYISKVQDNTDFNKFSYNKSAKVMLLSGDIQKGNNLSVSRGELFWDDSEGNPHHVSLDSVKKISCVYNRLQTGAIYALITFGSLTIMGIIGDATSKPAEGQMVGGAALGFITGLIWAPITFVGGYIIGQRVVYIPR